MKFMIKPLSLRYFSPVVSQLETFLIKSLFSYGREFPVR